MPMILPASRSDPNGAAQIEERCSRLLPRQFWFWDRDTRHPAGDLLVAHGFERIPPPPQCAGSPRYQLRLSARSAVTLWDFGFYFSRCGRGAVYLDRHECAARFCPEAGVPDRVWTRNALPWRGSRAPVALPYLAKRAFDWISRYEAWVVARYGAAYRRSVLRAWLQFGQQPRPGPGIGP